MAQLRRVLKRWAKRKAAGPDGWRPDELKDLPDEALAALCEFYAAVEATGRWPDKLSRNLVAMLTKAGTPDPSDRRPIVLLSAVYRLWAAARAAEMRTWLVDNNALQVGPNASAATQAADLALLIQTARTAGHQVDGLAVDWSKCYDRLPLEVLQEVAGAARIPQAISGPMLAAYRFPRRLVADSLSGEEAIPVCGLTPGCPAATHWLALLMYGWARELQLTEPTVRHREYVDDLTAHRRHNDPTDAVARVTRMIQVTEALARDARLQLNLSKSRCFSTHAPTRLALQGATVVPPDDHFIDLGVDQGLSRRPHNSKRKSRVVEMEQRCARIYLVPAPLHWRGNLTQASATSLGCYAPEANPIPMGLLHQMRHAAFVAAWRNTYRCAPELAFSLFLHWRADPLAIAAVAPLLYLSKVIRRGVCSREELMHAWDYCEDRFVGPIPAARQSFRIAGLSGTLCGCSNRHGTHVNLLTTPTASLKKFVLSAFRETQFICLAGRREPFRALMDGIDHWATTAFARSRAWKEPAKATLRTIMAGGAIPQAVAAKWVPEGPLCPFCRLMPEDNFHRYWVCPRWAGLRLRVLPDVPISSVIQALPRISLTHGILPADLELERLRRAAEKAGSLPAPVPLAHAVWTDGSACHPKDPALRRAAWAACWWDADGVLRFQQAQAPGPQTVGRAELSAACWVYSCNPAVPALYVDNRYVVDGINAVRAGQVEAYLDGPDADLWVLLRDLMPVTEPTWTPAHKDPCWYAARGLPYQQWLGNYHADALAKLAVRAVSPPPAVVGSRMAQLSALAAAQRMLAAVQGAVLDQKHAFPPGRNAKAKRKRNLRTRFLRRLHPRRTGPAPTREDPLPLPISTTWPGVHRLVPAAGPLTQAWSITPPKGVICWPATCQLCATTANDTAAWTRLARTTCPVDLVVGHALVRRSHELVRATHGWRCCRCGLAVRSAHRARMAGRTCPVSAMTDSTGQEVEGARAALRAGAFTARAWLHAHFDRPAVGFATAVAVSPPAPPAPLALRWVAHRIVTAGRLTLCLCCGRGNTARRPRYLAADPCPGFSPAAAAATQALRAGAFDRFLSTAPAATLDAARARGWLPPPRLAIDAAGAAG